jgi:hypothetical protein
MDTKKTYVMHAKSPEDKRMWLSAIEQVCIHPTAVMTRQ